MALLLTMNAYAIEITEESLLEYAKKSSPNLDEIESKLLKAQSDYAQVMDGLGTSVYTGYNHTSTQERAVNPFFPVYSPINQYQAGVIKPTKYGVRGIPTMLLFKDGELKATKVGATTKSNIVSWIKENI